MVEVQPPSYMSGGCYTAADMRAIYNDFVCAEGVSGLGALKVTATDGASMSVTVAAGSAWIEGTTNINQGYYHVINDAPVELEISESDATDARIDLVVARIYDSEFEGSIDGWAIEVIEGTAAPAPVAPAVPSSSLVLAQVNIPAGLDSVTNAEITDKRAHFKLCGGGSNVPLASMEFTSSGTFNPNNYPSTAVAFVEVVGGGGGGGGAGTTNASGVAAGSGGGGGGFGSGYIPISDMGGKNVTVTIGAGGAGGAAGNSQPSAGGSSSFGGFVIAGGGNRGTSVTNQTGAFYNIAGGSYGARGSGTHCTKGLYGGSGWNSISGGSANVIYQLGWGGAAGAQHAQPRVGSSADSGSAGSAGYGFGGGGMGAWNRHNQSARAGGRGSVGRIWVTIFP